MTIVAQTMTNLRMIAVDTIQPSPYQHRKDFSPTKIAELAKSITRDGLIEPIVVRSVNSHYELIAGERRWRAVKHAAQPVILARVVDATDLQARRMCAAENLQRQDLSAVEEVFAITELIDAEMADDATYAAQGIGTPIERVGWLLSKLDADYRNETDYFTHKFVCKVERIFDGLPRPKEWRSWYVHDFRPITAISEDVKETAIKNGLNKSQTKALDSVKKEAPDVFEKLTRKKDDDGKVVVDSPLPFDPFDEPTTLRDLSASEIKSMRYTAPPIAPILAPTEVQLGAYDGDEWYTPQEFIDAARELMEEIDLDPAPADEYAATD